MAERRRSKRQCAASRGSGGKVLPSAVHYVGYVEDSETPEMIMRKFEELERLVAASKQQDKQHLASGKENAEPAAAGPSSASAASTALRTCDGHAPGAGSTATEQQQGPSSSTHHLHLHAPQDAAAAADRHASPVPATSSHPRPEPPPEDAPLDDSLLLQVFKQTSIFNVRSTAWRRSHGHGGGGGGAGAGAEDGHAWAGQEGEDTEQCTEEAWSGGDEDGPPMLYLRGYWSEEEGQEEDDPYGYGAKGKGKKGQGKRQGGAGSSKSGGAGKAAHQQGGGRAGSAPPREPSMWKVLGVAARERNIRQQVVMQYNRDTHALIRRKVQQPTQADIVQVRVPGLPLPTAWGRTVQAYDPSRPGPRLLLSRAPLPLSAMLPPLLTPPPPPASTTTAPAANAQPSALLLPHASNDDELPGPAIILPPSSAVAGDGGQQQRHSPVPWGHTPQHQSDSILRAQGPAVPGGEQSTRQGEEEEEEEVALLPMTTGSSTRRHSRPAVGRMAGSTGTGDQAPEQGQGMQQPWGGAWPADSNAATTNTAVGAAPAQQAGGLDGGALPPCCPVQPLLLDGLPLIQLPPPQPSPEPSQPMSYVPPPPPLRPSSPAAPPALQRQEQAPWAAGGGSRAGQAQVDWPMQIWGTTGQQQQPQQDEHGEWPTQQQQQQHAWREQGQGVGLLLPPLPPPQGQAEVLPCGSVAFGHAWQEQQEGVEVAGSREPSPEGVATEVAGGAAEQRRPQCVAYVEAPDLARCDLQAALGTERTFTVVLINSGWEVEGPGHDDALLVSRLRELPVPALCPSGFVFVWARKTHMQGVCKQLYAWGYTYIENLTWVWMGVDNSVLRLPGTFCCRSHLTLIIFRKEGEGRDIQLRHQRSADVIFDCLRHDEATADPPRELYTVIETMLPEEVQGGRCLELWAPQGVRRPGWAHAVQTPGTAQC